jgi:hypothetical protein
VSLARDATISDNNQLVGLRAAFWDDAVETADRWDIPSVWEADYGPSRGGCRDGCIMIASGF